MKTSKEKKNQLHVARYYSWQPSTRRERTIRTKRVSFRNPAQFIRACRGLVTQWRPLGFTVMGHKGYEVRFSVSYGSDAEGRQKHLDCYVTWSEALMLDAYIRGEQGVTTLWTVVKARQEETDDDGGEALTVPSATDSLAEMPAIGSVQ